jgi:aspartate ammonia-lyase
MTNNLLQGCRLTLFTAAVALAVGLVSQTAWAQQPSPSPAPQPSQSTTSRPRIEKDLLGEKEVPANAYYGVQTARALENFQLSGIAINHYPGFVEAWAIVKLAAARANTDVGSMKAERLAAIEKAAQAVLAGKYHDQFEVD